MTSRVDSTCTRLRMKSLWDSRRNMFMSRFAWLSVGLLSASWELEGYSLLLAPHTTKFSPKDAGVPRLRCNRRGDSGVRSLHLDATSSLIETVACRTLRLVLRNSAEARVRCSVQSRHLDLVQGRISGASVKGRNWASRLGFTARVIVVDVGAVNLDIGALISRRVLEFHTPYPSGEALVVFDAEDFGNFLTHRLVRQAELAGSRFVFERTGVSVDPVSQVVGFRGTWGVRQVRVELSQAAHGCERLSARVTGGEPGVEGGGLSGIEKEILGKSISDFFNALEINLDGPRLRLRSLSFEGRGGRADAKLRLRLSIVVPKLPGIHSLALF